MREKPRDKGRLQHIMQAIQNIEEFKEGVALEEFINNKILFYAIVKNIEIIGEAVYMLSKEFKAAHPELPWTDIAGMRHVLVHDYYQVTPHRVWDTANSDLEDLKVNISHYLQDMTDE